VATTWLSYNGQPDFGLDNAAFLAKAGQMTAPSTTQIEEPSDRSDRKEPVGAPLSERSETSGYGKTINGAQRDSSSTNHSNGLAWQVFAGAEAALLWSASSPTEAAAFEYIYRAPTNAVNPNRARFQQPGLSTPSDARQPQGIQAPQPAAGPGTEREASAHQSAPASSGSGGAMATQAADSQDISLESEDATASEKDAQHRRHTLPAGSGSQGQSLEKPGSEASASSREKSSAKNRSAFDGVESPNIRPQQTRSESSDTESEDNGDNGDNVEEEILPDTLNSDSVTDLDATLFPSIETVVYSGTADATLTGNAADNTIAGNTGNDTINGGAGDDLLVGGAGNDVFVFGEQDGIDQIFDFASGDKLQFEGLENLNQLRLIEDETGMRVYFAETEVELVGTFGLQLSADWITSSR